MSKMKRRRWIAAMMGVFAAALCPWKRKRKEKEEWKWSDQRERIETLLHRHLKWLVREQLPLPGGDRVCDWTVLVLNPPIPSPPSGASYGIEFWVVPRQTIEIAWIGRRQPNRGGVLVIDAAYASEKRDTGLLSEIMCASARILCGNATREYLRA